MFRLTKALPFAAVWAWLDGVTNPIFKLLALVVAVIATVLLLVAGIVSLIIDIILMPFRLLL